MPNQGTYKAVELTSKSIDKSNVVKDLMPKAKEMLQGKKNGSVTIVAYKFNPETGQIEPNNKTPQAAATFTKTDGIVSGNVVEKSGIKVEPDAFNKALCNAQKQALLANVEGSKHSNKEALKNAIKEQFKPKDKTEVEPLDKEKFQAMKDAIASGNVAQINKESQKNQPVIANVPNNATLAQQKSGVVANKNNYATQKQERPGSAPAASQYNNTVKPFEKKDTSPPPLSTNNQSLITSFMSSLSNQSNSASQTSIVASLKGMKAGNASQAAPILNNIDAGAGTISH